jgi:hypothetical protein
MSCRTPALVLWACSTAAAQVVNGDFQTGSLPPWVVTPTPNGVSGFQSVVMYDIDGPGPAPPSLAAQFMVGRTFPGTSPEGISLAQPVPLIGGADYTLRFNWSVWAQVNVYSASGGTFELMVDGAVLNHAVAPVTVQGQTTYGQLAASFHAPQTRDYALAVRITRTTTFGEEVFQYLDNITAALVCYANCDGSSTPPLLTVNDFICFQSKFAAGESYANCDGSSTPPVLNISDFICFQSHFAAGCQ